MKKTVSLFLALLLCVGLICQPALAALETEDNNTLGAAQAVNLGDTIDASISVEGDVDFYSFTLPESGRLKLDMTAYFRYNCFYFYDENGTELWKDTENEWNETVGYRNEVYETDLLPGTYYLKITGYWYGTNRPTTGNYTLKTGFTPAKATETEPNNSIAEANALELGSSVAGHISINDRYDFYAITLPQSGRLTLDMTAYLQYNCLYFYDENGTEIWKDTENEWNSTVGSRNDVYNIDLLAGTYYLKITGYWYGTNRPTTGTYTLKTAFAPANATETEPNNSIAEANVFELNTSVAGHISINDRYDFYAVTLPQSGRLKLDMTAYLRYNCLYLYDVNGTEIWKDTENEWNSTVGYRNDVYEIDLTAGTYYIKVTGYRYNSYDGSTGTYTLTNEFTPANATETEPNNSTAEANALKAGAAVGQIAINDRYDFYTFTLENATELELNITAYLRYYCIYLYDTAGKELWKTTRNEWNSTAGYRSDVHKVALDPGTYYLKVTGYRYDSYDASTGTYQLSTGHEHSYTAAVTAPSCTVPGFTTYTCECGHSYEDDKVDALGHSFGDWAAAEEGKESRECSVCGETETRDVEEVHTHNFVPVVTEPGCTTRGCTTYTCECGDSYEDLYVNALGHDFGSWAAAEEGKESRECKRCGETETRDTEGHQHKHGFEITRPTCTEQGYTTYTCSCGDSYVDDYVDAIGHDEKITVLTAPTCDEYGLAEYTCVRCGASRTGELDPLPHDFHNDACVYCGNPAAYAETVSINYRKIKIILDGEEIIPCDGEGKTVEPFIMSSSGTTYLPLRAISQALGLNVHWDGVANTVTLKSDGTVKTGAGPAGTSVGARMTRITYRNIRVFLDGRQLRLVNSLGVSVEPFILNSNSSVYLPLRIIGEALGIQVGWDGDTSTVYLNTKSK